MEMRRECLGLGLKDTYVNTQLGGEPAQEQLERKEKNREGNTATGPLKLRL